MPTAVEHVLLEFLKLEIAGRGEQRELTQAIDHIDADFLKLTSSGLTQAEFLKFEHKISPDIRTIGAALFETGEDLTRLGRFAGALDDFLVKLSSGPGVPTAAAASTAGNPFIDDFLALDSALKISGADLETLGANVWKMSQSASSEEFAVKLHAAGRDAGTVATAFEDDQTTFAALASDFLKIDGESTNVDHKLGAALAAVGDDFGTLANDFLKFEAALGGRPVLQASTQSDFTAAAAALTSPSAAFTAATDDFLKLSHDLSAVAGPAATGINILLRNAYGGGGGTALP